MGSEAFAAMVALRTPLCFWLVVERRRDYRSYDSGADCHGFAWLLVGAGAGTSAHNESETIAKYEIMDGAPVRGENVPIR